MVKLAAENDDRNRKIRIREDSALPEFYYENGYTLLAVDMGKRGVKIDLLSRQEGDAAIILPPAKVKECIRWLSRTIEQRDKNSLKELSSVLKRMIRQKGFTPTLRRGDKKKIRDSLKLLEIR